MSSLCDHTDVYILVSGTTTVNGAVDNAARAADRNINKQYLKIVHSLPTA